MKASTRIATFNFWFGILRQLLVFSLGVSMVIYSVVDGGHNWGYIALAMFMLGIIPVDVLLTKLPTAAHHAELLPQPDPQPPAQTPIKH